MNAPSKHGEIPSDYQFNVIAAEWRDIIHVLLLGASGDERLSFRSLP
jgi:hypothetical protein